MGECRMFEFSKTRAAEAPSPEACAKDAKRSYSDTELSKPVDRLKLADDKTVTTTIRSGSDFHTESIWFSDNVVKTNKRGKDQERTLVITDKAIYNFRGGFMGLQCQRRISLSRVVRVLASRSTAEFLICTRGEHRGDYRLKHAQKSLIIAVIRRQRPLHPPLAVAWSDDVDYERLCVQEDDDATARRWKTAKQMLKCDKVARPFCLRTDKPLGLRLDGVMVKSVVEGKEAHRVGIRRGMVLFTIEGNHVLPESSNEQISAMFSKAKKAHGKQFGVQVYQLQVDLDMRAARKQSATRQGRASTVGSQGPTSPPAPPPGKGGDRSGPRRRFSAPGIEKESTPFGNTPPAPVAPRRGTVSTTRPSQDAKLSSSGMSAEATTDPDLSAPVTLRGASFRSVDSSADERSPAGDSAGDSTRSTGAAVGSNPTGVTAWSTPGTASPSPRTTRSVSPGVQDMMQSAESTPAASTTPSGLTPRPSSSPEQKASSPKASSAPGDDSTPTRNPLDGGAPSGTSAATTTTTTAVPPTPLQPIGMAPSPPRVRAFGSRQERVRSRSADANAAAMQAAAAVDEASLRVKIRSEIMEEARAETEAAVRKELTAEFEEKFEEKARDTVEAERKRADAAIAEAKKQAAVEADERIEQVVSAERIRLLKEAEQKASAKAAREMKASLRLLKKQLKIKLEERVRAEYAEKVKRDAGVDASGNIDPVTLLLKIKEIRQVMEHEKGMLRDFHDKQVADVRAEAQRELDKQRARFETEMSDAKRERDMRDNLNEQKMTKLRASLLEEQTRVEQAAADVKRLRDALAQAKDDAGSAAAAAATTPKTPRSPQAPAGMPPQPPGDLAGYDTPPRGSAAALALAAASPEPDLAWQRRARTYSEAALIETHRMEKKLKRRSRASIEEELGDAKMDADGLVPVVDLNDQLPKFFAEIKRQLATLSNMHFLFKKIGESEKYHAGSVTKLVDTEITRLRSGMFSVLFVNFSAAIGIASF